MARIVILRTQDQIIDFRLGQRPEGALLRDFATGAEVAAYQEGVDTIRDQYDRIESLTVAGAKATYIRHSDDPEAGPATDRGEMEFGTPAEADAFRQGVEDAEGFAAPLVIDDTDDRFDDLVAWALADRGAVAQ